MFKNLFQSYAEAFSHLDIHGISSFYEFPMVFYSETGEVVSFDKQAFNKNSQALLALYKEFAVAKVDFNIEAEQQLSQSLHLVSVNWHFKKDSGDLIYSALTRYLLGDTPTGPKIKSVFVVNESSKIGQLKTKKSLD